MGVDVRIGSLCSGYGGLELGVQAVFGGSTAWVSDIDKGACKILTHRFPGVPNIGDMTAVDWAAIEPVDLICGGTPCQDLSHAGKRAGMTEGTRSNLWVAMREAIATIRPRFVVWENVGGAYSAAADSDMEPDAGLLGDGPGRPPLRALGRVLGDLASLGYDASWHGVTASSVGAPHRRLRVFILAADTDGDGGVATDASGLRRGQGWTAGPSEAPRGWTPADPAGRGDAPVTLLGTPTARDGKGSGQGARLRESARRGQVEGQVLLLGQSNEALVGDGLAGRVLPAIDGEEVGQVLGGFGAECDGHGSTLAPKIQADLAIPSTSFQLLQTPAVNDMGEGKTVEAWDAWTTRMRAEHGNGNGHGASLSIEAQRLLPTPVVGDVTGGNTMNHGTPGGTLNAEVKLGNWGQYAAAIHRWEALTRPAPSPTETGPKGSPRLSAAFSEWMMGLPAGWVTDTPGITRNEALRALGNGVVPQQAAGALEQMLAWEAVSV
jgi:DNA (cytosine-5)-methyltransferase 1